MIKQVAVVFLMLFASDVAAAEEDKTIYIMPEIPTEAQKILALKLAYEANGNSMVGYGRMIDLTAPPQLPPPLTNEIMPAPKREKKK
jgi:hypothetical protein